MWTTINEWLKAVDSFFVALVLIGNITAVPSAVVTIVKGAFQPQAVTGGVAVPGQVSAFVLMLCLVFFAFTTILGWDYCGYF